MSRRQYLSALEQSLGADQFKVVDVRDCWPSLCKIKINDEWVSIAVHVGLIGSSSRGRDDAERRFQNPGKNRPIINPPGHLPLLLGLLLNENGQVAAVAAFDALIRVGTQTRFSLFVPIAALEAVDTEGWIDHVSTSGETIHILHPSLLPGCVLLDEPQMSLAALPDQLAASGFFAGNTNAGVVAAIQAATASNFGRRVSIAYGNACALCASTTADVVGVPIVPPVSSGSTVSDGIAVCTNHRLAFQEHRVFVDPATLLVRCAPGTDGSTLLPRLRSPVESVDKPTAATWVARYRTNQGNYGWIHEVDEDKSGISNTAKGPVLDVSGVLSSLAQVRGFLLESELPENLPPDGDLEVEVVSLGGEVMGTQKLNKQDGDGPLDILASLPAAQSPDEQDSLLQMLDLVEAQLLGWLLAHTEVGAQLTADFSEQLEELGVDGSWSQLLRIDPEGNDFVTASTALCGRFAEAALTRKHRSEMINVAVACWRTSARNNAADRAANRAISYWLAELARVRTPLLEENIRLVASVAKRYRRRLSFLDGLRIGLVGLNIALDRFETGRGYRLSTYATHWIRQSITRAVANHGNPIRVPVHLHEQISRHIRLMHDCWKPGQSLNQTLAMAAQQANLAIAKALHLSSVAEPTWPARRLQPSTDIAIEDTVFDATADPSIALTDSSGAARARESLRNAMVTLDESPATTPAQQRNRARDKDIITRRLGVGRPTRQTLETIGDSYDVTRERIRQVEAKTLKRLVRLLGAQIGALLDQVTGVGRG